MSFYGIENGRLRATAQPPPGFIRLLDRPHLPPPLVGALHRSFGAWEDHGRSPGPVTPKRIWIGPDGALAFHFTGTAAPPPLLQIGLAPDLAAWLVLLDKWMETFVIVAHARSHWDVTELAGALSFMTPAFLPRPLLDFPPDNWARIAQALALAVADGPMKRLER